MNETCDTCGPAVKAVALIGLPSGGTLTYCGHCTTLNAVALLKIGAIILDDREVL